MSKTQWPLIGLQDRRPTILLASAWPTVLERAGLITKLRQGREQRVTGNSDALREAHRALDQLETIWRQRIDSIDEILADPTDPPEGAQP